MTQRGKISLMLFFFATCASAALFSHFLQVREMATPSRDLFGVINNQLAAFRSADYPRAYQQASTGFQQRFSVEQFKEMIGSDYAVVLHRSRVEYGSVQFHQRRAYIQVFFIADDGNVHPCIYTLINEGDTWKVDGARLLPRWPIGHRMTGIRT